MSTVSKALNGNTDISSKTREQIIHTANEMGYFPDANARALKLKKTYNIGVLYDCISELERIDSYIGHILSSFYEEAALYGYDITFIEHHVGRKWMTYLEHCRYRRFDGVCIMCADRENEEVKELAGCSLPVVAINNTFPNTCSIISDNRDGMKQLTNYIISQGHKKIAYIHGGNSQTTKKRLNGFYDALEEHHIAVPKDYVLEGQYKAPDITAGLAVQLLTLEDRPTCIIAPDDHSALGIVNAANKLGLYFAKDISAAGYDSLSSQQYHEVMLTSVKQDREKIGREASEKLIQMIEHPNENIIKYILVKQTLVIGTSVRKVEG